MKDIKLEITLNKANWLEATWSRKIEKKEENKTIITYEQIWCECYSGNNEHIHMLKNKAKEFETSLDEYKVLIEDCISKYIYPNEEDIKKQDEIARIQAINNKSESIITTPYPIYKQLNIDNELAPYTYQDRELKNMFIETVRLVGRKAKENGTLVDEINWSGLDEIENTNDINFEATKVIRDRIIQDFSNES